MRANSATYPTHSYDLQIASVRQKGPQILSNYDNMMKYWRKDVYHVDRYSGARIKMEMNETRNWFQAQILLVYKPTYLESLSNGFGLKGNGKVKASQSKVFGEIYGPLIVPWLWWSSQHSKLKD